MKRRTGFARFAACLLALSVILAFSAAPALAESTSTDPGSGGGTDPSAGSGTQPGTGDSTQPGTGDGTQPGTGDGTQPGAFTLTGVVIDYDIPGVAGSANGGDAAGADKGATDGNLNGSDGTGDQTQLTADASSSDGEEVDEDSDETVDEVDEDTGESDATVDEDTDNADGSQEENAIQGPFITIANETGEFTYAVAEAVVIEAPQNEAGEYVINEGDLATVSGTDDVVDHIVVTPADSGERSPEAAVPGQVEAISATDIIVKAADGSSYSFLISEATMVYSGPDTISVADISVGSDVVVKGDGAGGAEWIRLIGGSKSGNGSDGAQKQGLGGGKRNGGDGRGHGSGHGHGHDDADDDEE